jgi:hypothetical protein
MMCAMAMQAQQPSQPSPVVSPADSAKTANEERVKQQAILIPQGGTVEMRLFNGKKLRGRLGQVSDQGVALRSVFENRIEERTINFADIKSIRYYNPMMPRMVTTYILAGVSMAVSIALAATR